MRILEGIGRCGGPCWLCVYAVSPDARLAPPNAAGQKLGEREYQTLIEHAARSHHDVAI